MYECNWKNWDEFTKDRPPLNLDTTIPTVLEFLQHLKDKRLGYNAINSARSTLSLILNPIHNGTVGNQPIETRFLKGIHHLTPPRLKYSDILDPQTC